MGVGAGPGADTSAGTGVTGPGADRVILQVIGLHKLYGDFRVLDDINLQVRRGEVVCIVGPSGSGKSTFLRTINHLETIDEGRIIVNGNLVGYEERDGSLIPLKEGQIANRRRDIGMVFQSFNLFWNMTLLENVMLGPCQVLGILRDEAQDRAVRLLRQVGLGDKLSNYPLSLSGGQQQRGAIARALAMEPSLMLFDEPTSALDPDMTREVLEVVKQLAASGMTMMIVSHEMAFVREASTRVVMLRDGRIEEDITDVKSSDLSQFKQIGSYLQTAV